MTSTNADASPDDDAPQSKANHPKPFWQDNPEIQAIIARTMADIESTPPRPPIDYPDPILHDAWTGSSVRELRDARDDLTRAKARYDEAVCAARRKCLSWGQIGTILGVSRQHLHRRYRGLVD